MASLASIKCESAVERSSLELGMTEMEPGRLAGKRKRAVSIFIPQALRRILVCSGRYSRFGPPNNKPAEVGDLALSIGSVRMAKEIRKKRRKEQSRDTYIRWREACPHLYRSFAERDLAEIARERGGRNEGSPIGQSYDRGLAGRVGGRGLGSNEGSGQNDIGEEGARFDTWRLPHGQSGKRHVQLTG